MPTDVASSQLSEQGGSGVNGANAGTMQSTFTLLYVVSNDGLAIQPKKVCPVYDLKPGVAATTAWTAVQVTIL